MVIEYTELHLENLLKYYSFNDLEVGFCHICLAHLYKDDGRYDDALKNFEAAIESYSQHYNPYVQSLSDVGDTYSYHVFE